jgi:hypothetical protein
VFYHTATLSTVLGTVRTYVRLTSDCRIKEPKEEGVLAVRDLVASFDWLLNDRGAGTVLDNHESSLTDDDDDVAMSTNARNYGPRSRHCIFIL